MNDDYYDAILEDERELDRYWEAILKDGDWFDTVGQTGGASFTARDFVQVEPLGQRKSPKFGLHFKRFQVSVREMSHIPFAEIPKHIVFILEYILTEVLKDVADHNMVRLRLDAKSLEWSLWTPPTKKSQLSVQRWMLEIEKILNSHEELVLDNSFHIEVQHTDIPVGSCNRNVSKLLYSRLESMKSVVQVKNQDFLCLPRALVVGKAYADEDAKLFRRLKRGKKLWTWETRKPIEKTGLEEREFTLGDLSEFQKTLSEYQIIVISSEHLNHVVFSGTPRDKHIALLHHNHHFDFLKFLPAFFKRNYWCFTCQKGYNNRTDHRCESRCHSCLRAFCRRDPFVKIHCNDCRRTFFGKECFDAHKSGPGSRSQKTRRPICGLIYSCEQCLRTVSLQKRKGFLNHQCGETFSIACQCHVLPETHQCFMRPHSVLPEELRKNAEAKLLFFDIETYVNDHGQLVPNLIVMQDMSGKERIFPGSGSPMNDMVCDEFCAFLFSPQFQGHYVIAHNFKAFDGYFLLEWLLKSGIVPKVILNGGKILQLDVPKLNIRFRDSINCNPQALAKWPVTFGLPDISKGEFPHSFNRPHNWDRVVDFPSLTDFGFSSMPVEKKKTFLDWYEKEKNEKKGRYDFRKEIVSYCSMDVTVLRRCCLKFRNLFLEVSGGLCPFVSALTIAGLCNLYWRSFGSFVLEPNQIGLLPSQGFGRNRIQSAKALRWLSWEADARKCRIKTKSNGGEFRVGSLYVDGYCLEQNKIFEFYGCWYHGCPSCTDADTVHPYRNLPMAQLYAETHSRQTFLEKLGYLVETVWEHEYDEKLKSNDKFRLFTNNVKIFPPLNPREAFYGGRTNAVKLHHKASSSEKILYYDVCSEYPFVNKTKPYPIGHPIIINDDFRDPEAYFGIMVCTVLPPKNLHLPVLPYRCHGKLIFPLCRTCAVSKLNAACTHSLEEREITGTWCTPEILEATKRGYTVRKIFEVWHFPTKKERLFEKYIDKFLKMKTEANGWPRGVETESEKRAYLTEYQRVKGITLDYNNIVENPGLRALAKLCLNSFWGWFGMQDNKLNTMYIEDSKSFYDMLLSGKNHVHSWDLFSEEVLQVTFTKEEDFVELNLHTNVILAAFTTCWARLHLYNYMTMVEDRLLYFDTDSIIFVQRPGTPEPPTGIFLGELTNELKPGQFTEEFVSLGAKSYAYRTNTGDCVVKIKGFTVNTKTSEHLNFDSMLSMLQTNEPVVVSYPNMIQRVKRSMQLQQADSSKKFRITYDKRRVIDEHYNTLPYGYCDK